MKTKAIHKFVGPFCLIAVLTALSSRSLAESYFAALPCKPSEAYLIATHDGPPSKEAEPFWLQALGSQPFSEKVFEVPAGQSQVIPLTQTLFADWGALALKTRRGSPWQFKSFCASDRKVRKIENKTSPWKSTLGLKSTSTKTAKALLTFVNLSQQEQKIELHFLRHNKQIHQQTLKAPARFGETRFEFGVPPTTDKVELRAEGRWTGTVEWASALDSAQEKGPRFLPTIELSEETVVKPTSSTERYFLVKSQVKSDTESFVVPMTDPQLIAEALTQIADPNRQRLLVARIEKGFHGTNRDLLHPNKTPWSWQIQEALQFGDFASIVCDGSPSMVEERIDDWIVNTGGNICFWNYRVVEELSAKAVEGRKSR